MISLNNSEATFDFDDGKIFTYPIMDLLEPTDMIIYNELLRLLKQKKIYLQKEVYRTILFVYRQLFIEHEQLELALSIALEHEDYGKNLTYKDKETVNQVVKLFYNEIAYKCLSQTLLRKYLSDKMYESPGLKESISYIENSLSSNIDIDVENIPKKHLEGILEEYKKLSELNTLLIQKLQGNKI